MNKVWYSLILALGFAFGCTTTNGRGGRDDFSDTNLSSSREVVLTVHGLSCPLCSTNLDGQLKTIVGVEAASIDLKTGSVTVRLGEGHSVTARDLADAVRNAGFTLKKIEAQESDK